MSNNALDTTKTYLVTGCAGFIGYYLSKELLEMGCRVIGIDNINDYYDIKLKHSRLEGLNPFKGFSFVKGDISDRLFVGGVFDMYKPHIVVNLAAQAGVRYSIENPDAYFKSNMIGYFNILEACRNSNVEHLVYASSSSVYGANKKLPFEESDFVDHPISFYAATKKSNELMSYTYSHIYGLPTTGLRFFTVYGPMGRPDMSYFAFTDRYFKGEPVKIYNNSDFEHDLYRDFTYIDDIIEGVVRLLGCPPSGDEPYEIYNIGNNKPEKLMDFIIALESALGRVLGRRVVFNKIYEPLKAGDVPATYASTEKLREKVGFKPSTSIEEGLYKFAKWYVEYYGVK